MSAKNYKQIGKSAFGPAYMEDSKSFQSHRGRIMSLLGCAEIEESVLARLEHQATAAHFVTEKSRGSFQHEGQSYRWNSSVRSYEVGFGATKAFVAMNKCRSNSTLTGDRFAMPEGQTLKVNFESPYIFDIVVRQWCKANDLHLKDFKKSAKIAFTHEVPKQQIAEMVGELALLPSVVNGISVPVPRFNQQWMKALQGRINRGLYVPQVDRTLQKRLNKEDTQQAKVQPRRDFEGWPSWAIKAYKS